MADLSCGSGICIKYIMFFLNFIFWVVGAAMLGIGIWLAVDDPGFLDDILESENPMDDPLWAAAVYTCIGVGAFVFLLGFLGCCGACTQNTCMLCLYVILVSIVLLAEVVGVILMLVFWTDIDSGFEESMRETVKTKYGLDDDTITQAQDNMQKDLKCCGGSNYTDYVGSAWANLPGNTQTVPESCCRAYEKDDNDDLIAQCQEEAKTPDITRADPQLYKNGCYQSVWDWIDDNAVIFIAVICSFIGLQILGLIFGCCLKSAINKGDDVV